MTQNLTPMMQQYADIKTQHENAMLFYRMGDFYEMFGDDAKQASAILGITLTQRRNKSGEEGLPMCGVPYHAAEGYIAKLLKHGHKVALCEQTETPEQAKARGGYKALVKREVTRLYTGGTLTEDSMLKAEENNYLTSITKIGNDFSISWADLSTGEFATSNITKENLGAELSRLDPTEIIITEELLQNLQSNVLKPYMQVISDIPNHYFNSKYADEEICGYYQITDVNALGFENRAQISAAGALLAYVKQTQVGKAPQFKNPNIVKNNTFLQIDAATRKNLELIQTLQGEKQGSLFNAINKTVTPAGSRAFAQWLMAPLTNITKITNRQNAIDAFYNNEFDTLEISNFLKHTADISRAVSRLSLNRGGPRDLKAIADTLEQIPSLQATLKKFKELPEIANISNELQGFEELIQLLNSALNKDNLPMLARDGGFINKGFDEQLDKFKNMASGGMNLLKELEREEAENTSITNLRIKYNKVWGHFIEITNLHKNKVPESWIHRQTTTNSMRFSTPKLMGLEQEYSAAAANALNREQELFDGLVNAVQQNSTKLLIAADAIATLDVLTAAATLAKQHNYCRPVVDNSNKFIIEGGRHPVVEQTVDNFIANNSNLSDHGMWLITGPNMAGKSTFLRQNALIALMAHTGLFVPAKNVHIGVIDKIFTRIGAADDLARGQSTFMVEMVETATILNNATDKSLVILDEIGRGTATYDGLSIAWGCVEHLVEKIKARGLFATHYHEMTELEETYNNLHCYHAAVKEWHGEIIFLHEIKKGAAPGSYGVHVGKLAGLPKSVTKRAEQILQKLEAGHLQNSADLPLFGSITETKHTNYEEPQNNKLEEKLAATEVDNLTPREAHQLLYELKDMLKK